ncbi:MAG: hypothetical protein A2X23_13845 [Chloroflexi bacterium GWC2_73_18]|nr:MAG: hypothetical protein A2X23_13845 [Chloroflexi bacterium GWC2_73_18]
MMPGSPPPDSDENLRLQADEHPLVDEREFVSLQQRVLHLMHLQAYEEASRHAAARDVLDLGCNTGYGTIGLAAVANRTVGVDVSPAAIEEARRRPGASVVEWLVVDGLTLPFADATFDLVMSFQVLEHIADPGPYLAEIARVLRGDGMALLTTPNAAIRLDAGDPPWNRFHVREYQAAELPAVLGASFDDVEVLGMFASPLCYRTEFDRVDVARRRHAAKLRLAREGRLAGGGRRPAAWRALRRLVPEPLAAVLRRARRRAAAQQRAPSGPPRSDLLGTSAEVDAALASPDTAAPSLADLWYAPRDLDRALDLLAVCRRPRRGAAA